MIVRIFCFCVPSIRCWFRPKVQVPESKVQDTSVVKDTGVRLVIFHTITPTPVLFLAHICFLISSGDIWSDQISSSRQIQSHLISFDLIKYDILCFALLCLALVCFASQIQPCVIWSDNLLLRWLLFHSERVVAVQAREVSPEQPVYLELHLCCGESLFVIQPVHLV